MQHGVLSSHLKPIPKMASLPSRLIGKFEKNFGNALLGADILTGSSEFERFTERVS